MPDQRKPLLTPEEDKAKQQAVKEHYHRLPDRTAPVGQPRNVIGVGIGPRIKDGKQQDETCVRFYVERRIPLELIDERFQIPKKIGDVPTDVIETRRFVSFGGTAAPGATIGLDYDAPNVDPTIAGTLGAVVKIGETLYALGANHVMAVNGRVPPGTRIIFRPPDKFIDDPSNYILARVAVYIRLCPTGTNEFDCALAAVENPDRLTGEFPDRIVQSANPIDPRPGMKVARVDEIDSATGVIEEIDARVRIDYRFGTFDFDHLVLIKGDNGPFAQPGDSGALVVDLKTKQATAMIIGGSMNYTIACPLSPAIEELIKQLPEAHRGEGKFELVLDKLRADVVNPVRDEMQKVGSHVKDLFQRIVRDVESKVH